MELSPNSHVPDGLLAAMTLLSEKPHQGVPSWESAPHQGIDERNCTALLGLRFRSSEIVSGTVVAPYNTTPIKSWWQKNWHCVANVGLPVLMDDLNPFSLGIGTAADTASQMSQASLEAAGAWSVQRGLTVPLRSSIVRAGVANAEALGRASFLLSVIGVDYALGEAIYAEQTGCRF